MRSRVYYQSEYRTNGNNLDPNRPTVNVYESRNEYDPFPNPSIFYPRDDNRESDVKLAVNEMRK